MTKGAKKKEQSKEPSMAFYVSIYEMGDVLPEKSRHKYLVAVLDYYFRGTVPDMDDKARKQFNGIRGRLDNAKRRRDEKRDEKSAKSEDSSVAKSEDSSVAKSEDSSVQSGSGSMSRSLSGSEEESGASPAPPYAEIVTYLNERAGTAFKASSKTTRSLINARFRDGFTADDFRAVIDGRCEAWLKKPDMREYLRPRTLFGTKFEDYLNAMGSKGGCFHDEYSAL